MVRATLLVAAGLRDVIWQLTGSRDASEACPCDSPLPNKSHNLPEHHQLGPAIETWASAEHRDLSLLDEQCVEQGEWRSCYLAYQKCMDADNDQSEQTVKNIHHDNH